MYDSQSNQSRKLIYAIVGIVVAVIFVIITVSVIAMNAPADGEAVIINEQDVQPEQMSDESLTDVKKALYTLLHSTMGADNNFDVAVRWDTLKIQDNNTYTVKSFIVDVDEYKQTYQANVVGSMVELSCPKIGESKYPESFCIGNVGDYDDSIYVVFGENLPYGGYTSEDEYFSIARNTTASMSDVGDRYLDIQVLNCDGDNQDDVIARTNEAVDEVLTSLGAPTNLFERKINVLSCHDE